MAPEDLKCGSSLSRTLFIVLVSVVGALILISVTFFVVRRCRRRMRERRAARGDTLGNYTAVYTRDQDDAVISMSDRNNLIANESGTEFDV
jgi:hypothetical protein